MKTKKLKLKELKANHFESLTKQNQTGIVGGLLDIMAHSSGRGIVAGIIISETI